MILHFIPYDPKFTRTIIKIIQYFNADEHTIFVYGRDIANKKDLYTGIDNIILGFKGNRIKIIKLVNSCNGIIFHSLFDPKIILMLFINRSLLKKSNWIAWGGDIYGLGNPDDSIKKRIKFLFLRSIAGKFKYLTTLADGDYDIAAKKIGVKGKHLRWMYMSPEVDSIIKIREENYGIYHEPINIQVGNSATESNQHIEAFDILSKYKDENIRIFVPLSYGDHIYAKKVIKYGRENFGDKFIPLTQLIDNYTYSEHLSKIHIGIFNNDRQQGMGNIGKLLFFGS